MAFHNSPVHDGPLTWREARSRLRSFLTDYASDTPSTAVKERSSVSIALPTSIPPALAQCFKWDIDIFLGALGSSCAILIIGVVASIKEGFGVTNEDVPIHASFRPQLAASVLLFVCCLLNLWLLNRRRQSNEQGRDSLKRRVITKFLRKIKYEEDDSLRRSEGLCATLGQGNIMDLTGNALTDVYSVYRRSIHQSCGGSWFRIPTLLLVRGDHIALQIGDIAPAACRLLEDHHVPVTLVAGERITLETFQETSTSIAGELPRGRTTLPKDSEKLLTLCNNVRLYEVLETPLEGFLRQPRVASRRPRILRQLDTVRLFLSSIGVVVFIGCIVILYLRVNLSQAELWAVLPVPFLVAIATSPLIGLTCLTFIEALGTARILAAYHPVATLKQDSSETSTNIDLLLARYYLATLSNRLSLQDFGRRIYQMMNSLNRSMGASDNLSAGPRLVRVPPASLNLLEKLGVASAFTLVDDELVCEPQAVPQQLLIPSGKGLKLLDLCPTYEYESDDESDSDTALHSRRSEGDFRDSDSDSDDELIHHHSMPNRQKRRRLLRKAHRESAHSVNSAQSSETIDHDVQFEDPLWWQHLPSLKCIGLACLLVDEKDEAVGLPQPGANPHMPVMTPTVLNSIDHCKRLLIRQICIERRSMQLRSVAQCIGFSTEQNELGENGDISSFVEMHRLHVISTPRVKERLEIDSHERDSEESRWWGSLRADSTSVIVQDTRSGSYQLLTVGDPRVVTRMCSEAWQGENSTILPLSWHDRAMILETSNGWRLGDLDVEAFSYAPIPHTFEQRCFNTDGTSKFYLLDNDPRGETLSQSQKDKSMNGEWPLLHNQIFLGVLGSLIIPRQETQGLLSTLQDAGVRFVFMSPRNMRLTKEIASQMGIDIAWNAAISLRPLEEGEEDKHRMISNYADWDVNAKLPHGIDNVRRHLKEVDNVPLLVSLFTDVTKVTTMQMIETFQDYNDTVIAVGLSHLPWNSSIFSTADLGIGVDVLSKSLKHAGRNSLGYNSLFPSEIMFVSAISAHACAFRLRGVQSIAYMPTILAHGRASLDAAYAAALFLLSGGLSYALFILFSLCSIATVIPLPEVMGAFLSLQVILPLIGIPMTLSDADKKSMNRVPPKNDLSTVFGKREGRAFFLVAFLKSLPHALFPQILYLIAFGELMIYFEGDLLHARCNFDQRSGGWFTVIRCQGIQQYTGTAMTSAIAMSLAEFLVCIIVASAGFVHRTIPIYEEPPWRRNKMWACSTVVALLIVSFYLWSRIEEGSFSALPWYFFALAGGMPFLCLLWVEYFKRIERALLDRAEKLRRLQFETRLGMWSPK